MRNIILSLIVTLLGTSYAQAANGAWNLPSELDDKNVQVSFEIDSTWHLIHGTTKGIHGRLWLADEHDPHSVNADIFLPVNLFDTDNSHRDSRLREVMHAEQHPEVRYQVERIEGLPLPSALYEGQVVPITLHGKLSIDAKTAMFSWPATIVRHAGETRIDGKNTLQWAEFGIEDPSILVARLDPTVAVEFHLKLITTPEIDK